MALPVLGVIATGLAALATQILRHPIITKMLFFAVFVAILHTTISYILYLIRSYIASIQFVSLLYYFCVIDAISLFVSIIISGWAIKQLIAFVRST